MTAFLVHAQISASIIQTLCTQVVTLALNSTRFMYTQPNNAKPAPKKKMCELVRVGLRCQHTTITWKPSRPYTCPNRRDKGKARCQRGDAGYKESVMQDIRICARCYDMLLRYGKCPVCKMQGHIPVTNDYYCVSCSRAILDLRNRRR